MRSGFFITSAEISCTIACESLGVGRMRAWLEQIWNFNLQINELAQSNEFVTVFLKPVIITILAYYHMLIWKGVKGIATNSEAKLAFMASI